MENKCFLCKTSSGKPVHKENGYESLICPECGLLFCNPLPDSEMINWEMDAHPDQFYKLPSIYKARWLSKKIGSNMSLLEVGAGNGHQLNEFAKRGFEVFGLEPNILRAEKMKQSYNLKAYQGFLETYDFKGEKFDVIFHIDLLAHFPDPFLAMEKMKAAIKDDGYICFEVGVVGGISKFWYRLFPLGLPQHRWLYSEKSLVKFLDNAKLVTIHKTTHSLAPYLIIGRMSNFILVGVSRRLLRPFIGKRVSVLFELHNNIASFLRYKVGRYFPNIGPLTVLYITKPQ